MNKTELTKKISADMKITKKDAGIAVDAILETITDVVGTRQKVQIPGFGTFDVRDRKSYIGRNPKSGEEIEIQSVSVPIFKASRRLRNNIAYE